MAAFVGEKLVAPPLLKPGGVPPGSMTANTKLQVTVSPVNVVISRGNNN